MMSDDVKKWTIVYNCIQVLSSDALDYSDNRQILGDALCQIAKNMMEVKSGEITALRGGNEGK